MDLTGECRGDRATLSMIVHGLQNLRRMQILQSRAYERDSMCGGRGKNVQDNPNPNPSKYHRATKAANPFLSVSTTTAVPRLRTGNFHISAFRPVYHDRTLSFRRDCKTFERLRFCTTDKSGNTRITIYEIIRTNDVRFHPPDPAIPRSEFQSHTTQ